jgi:hypothetical protein
MNEFTSHHSRHHLLFRRLGSPRGLDMPAVAKNGDTISHGKNFG